MITIELTTQEANMLVTLLDLLVKSRGLEVAQPAYYFYKIFNRAYHQEQHEQQKAKEAEAKEAAHERMEPQAPGAG